MTDEVLVVCEAAADQRTGCALADRVLCHEISWLEPELLDSVRAWRGYAPATGFVAWREIPTLVRARGLKAHGHFGGSPGLPDARAARYALLLAHGLEPRPRGVVLLRDLDDQPERRLGLEQARADYEPRVSDPVSVIVIGVANTKRECWVLAAFQPHEDAERDTLAALRQQLGFDPTAAPELLTAKQEDALRSAKRVLHALLGDDPEREAACLEADLELLLERGVRCGLADYLRELRDRLAPLLVR